MDSTAIVTNPDILRLTVAIARSFRRLVGKDLVAQTDSSSPKELAARLYTLPAVVLSHDGTHDPTFTFANLAAQDLFEYSWDEFLQTKSRQSAEPDHRAAREEMLVRAARDGYIADYSGVRITGSGRRFEIHDALIWNVTDQSGAKLGQAAIFDTWTYLS